MTFTTLTEGLSVKAVTEKAILLEVEGEDVWIPRKLIEEGDMIYRGMDSGNLSVKTWFVQQEGLPTE